MRVAQALLFALFALTLMGTAMAADQSCGVPIEQTCSSADGEGSCPDKQAGHDCAAHCGMVCAALVPVPPAALVPLQNIGGAAAAATNGLPNFGNRPDLPPPRLSFA